MKYDFVIKNLRIIKIQLKKSVNTFYKIAQSKSTWWEKISEIHVAKMIGNISIYLVYNKSSIHFFQTHILKLGSSDAHDSQIDVWPEKFSISAIILQIKRLASCSYCTVDYQKNR